MKLQNKDIRVLIVDDSAFMRKIINDLLGSDPEISVIGHARNGEQALQMIKNFKPDVITMDIEMPVLNGLQTLEVIMKENPRPVIMLSSLTEEGSVHTIRALELGAVDFIQKPTLSFMITSSQFREDLVTKVKASVAYRINPQDVQIDEQTKVVATKTTRDPSHQETCQETSKKVSDKRITTGSSNKLVAIAVSTGGPKALQSVIPKLPGNLPAAVLVVQHMPAGFTKSLADRLNQLSEINVKEAEDGELIIESTVYIAPGGYHMRVVQKQGKAFVQLSKDPPVSGHRPAADQLFESLSTFSAREIVCVVMTGMGSDGTKGIKKLSESSRTYVIAQSEESCVVYGMPKSVSLAGLVDEITPLGHIANAIISRIGGR